MITDRSEGVLSIHFKVHPGQLFMVLIGIAENYHDDFLERALEDANVWCEANRANCIAIDVRELALCFNPCIRIFTNWMTGSLRPAKIDLYLGDQAWQITSMKDIAQMSRYCKIIENSGSCPHKNTKVDEEGYYAPTGKGTTVYRTTCSDCDLLLHEYFVYDD